MYPFSKRTVMLATAAVVALPQAAVFAQEDATYQLVPVATQMSATPSAGSLDGEGSIGEVMPQALATNATSANSVEFTITGIGNAKTKTPAVSGLDVLVFDAETGAQVASGKTDANGKFKTPDNALLTKSYYATLSDGTTTMKTAEFKGTTFKSGAAATAVKATFVKADDLAIADNGVGAIKGYVSGNATVLAYDAKNQVWTVPVTSGKFNVYLPAGKYNVVVVNKDASGRNVLYKGVTVAKGQASAPLQDMDGTVTYANPTAQQAALGLKDTTVTLSPTSKKLSIKDTSFADVNWTSVDSITLSLFDVTDATPTLLGTQIVKTAPKTGKTVDFTLKNVLPGKKLQIKAVDGAFNTAKFDLQQVGNLSSGANKGTASSGDVLYTVDSTQNTVENTIDIGFKDNAKVSTDKILLDNITAIKVGNTTLKEAVGATKYDAKKGFLDAKGNVVTGDYIKATGKITFAPGALNKDDATPGTAGDKTIVINATGFDPITITQTLLAGAASNQSTAAFTTADGITITAKDQYGNVLKKDADAAFFMDITPSITGSSTTNDVIKIDGATFNKTAKATTNTAVKTKKVGDNGAVKVPVDLANFKTVGAKVTVQVKVKSGTEYKNAGSLITIQN